MLMNFSTSVQNKLQQASGKGTVETPPPPPRDKYWMYTHMGTHMLNKHKNSLFCELSAQQGSMVMMMCRHGRSPVVRPFGEARPVPLASPGKIVHLTPLVVPYAELGRGKLPGKAGGRGDTSDREMGAKGGNEGRASGVLKFV